MAKVVYVGSKPQFPVYLPIGAKTKSSIRKTVILAPGEAIELSDKDAEKLIDMNTHKNEKGEVVVKHFALEGEEPVTEPAEVEAKPKKKGRKKKAQDPNVEQSVEDTSGEDEEGE